MIGSCVCQSVCLEFDTSEFAAVHNLAQMTSPGQDGNCHIIASFFLQGEEEETRRPSLYTVIVCCSY